MEDKWTHLPLVSPDRAEVARREEVELTNLADAPRGKRYGYYLKKTGPG